MHVKILGPGCKKCQTLEARTRDALAELGLTAQIDEVGDYGEIAEYGVMKTPGLVIDDEVLVSGRVPTPDELRDLIANHTDTSTP